MKNNKLIMILCAVMAFTSFFAVDAFIAEDTGIVAYAASLKAPSVTVKSSSYSTAKISWKKVSSAKKYVVYRSTKKSSGYKAVKTIKKNSTVSYTDKKLTCGKTYYYKVTAVNGKKKKTSAVKSVKTVPAVPLGYSVSSSACGVNTVKYKAVSGATGYQIYYSASKNGTYKAVASVKAVSYNHKIGLGKSGYYKVRAYRKVNGKNIYGAFTAVKSKTAVKHTYGAYYVTKSATCAQSGSKTAVCKTCGAKTTAVIPADPIFYEHQYSAYVVTEKATCDKNGTETKTCKLCKKQVTRVVQKLSSDGTHSWNREFTVDVEPSCTKEGRRSIYCSVCNAVKDTEIIAPVPHTYTHAEYIGNETHMQSCEICGNELVTKCNYIYSVKIVPTKLNEGIGVHTCAICNYSYETVLEKIDCDHPQSSVVTVNDIPATCDTDGYTGDVYCSDCETLIKAGMTIDKLGHNMEDYALEPSCTTEGKTCQKCSVCGYEENVVILPASHSKTMIYAFNSDGIFCYVCGMCNELVPTNAITLNLGDPDSINYEGVAVYDALLNRIVLSGTSMVNDFDLMGDTDITVTVNASVNTDVKLCGVNINTTAADCIKINNKAPKDETTGLKPSVDVSLSAKDGSVNTLTANTSGNAIDSETRLTFKGHGVLNANASSSAITCTAKMEIKNLTLNVNSSNRGIDTREQVPMFDAIGNPVTDVNGNLIYDNVFYNISIGANANVTINSTDDAIRCKNMEFELIDSDAGDVDTKLIVVSQIGDGIQLEGNTGLTMNSGDITVTAGKRAFNFREPLMVINNDLAGNPLGRYNVISCAELFKI
ncbi:MAG: hypothetical protein NC213_03815 [Acetobacter sp.]|nr:hypothetical protein [Bacteroides sp.]MCM1340849.1 hypothetical protein [Acetobacter sp.]MCM1432594.1 hypothetical protein [Clostridiales bacterium]